MHTVIVTLLGLVTLAIMVGLAPRKAVAAKTFIGVWLVACIIHLSYGVIVAGYGLWLELGVHAVVFGVPAGVALIIRKKTS